MTAPTHPGDRRSLRTFVSTFAVTVALSALALCATVASGSAQTTLAWGGAAAAVVLSTAVATAAHARRTARDARHRLDGATTDIQRLRLQQACTTEEARQERERLLDEIARQRRESTESLAAEQARLEEEGARELDRLQQENAQLSGEAERARRDRVAAISATSNVAARMQALATATLADLRAMEDRYADEDVLADLLHLDHRTAQAGRLADSIAVLTGARSGRRWARPIGMESILRGAMGRIAGYRRVRVHSGSETAVAGHAAEGVMHVLAELLDNAANFSPPTAEVHVYVEEVPAGLIVSVEDSGLVMGEVQRRRAEWAVSGDVSELGGLSGTRLGLAVVGQLARKHGLKVSFRPSARGGTGVLMIIPREILSSPSPAGPAATATRPKSTPPAQEPAPLDTAAAVQTSAAPPELGPAGLPKRRRGRTLAEAERARPAATVPRTPPAIHEAQTHVARFSSFRQAVRPSAPADRLHHSTAPEGAASGGEDGTREHTAPDAYASESPPASARDDRTCTPARGIPDVRTPDAHNGAPHGPAQDGKDSAAHSTPDDRPSGPDMPGAGEHGSPAPSHAHQEGDTTS
ncbi:sensor histidine kinase [Streptomyces chartreusis]|uniref:sensor histidine kinase n=1 Tax=Streptomyces chartreusis TaxID=1969 RepID=UPI0036CEB35C